MAQHVQTHIIFAFFLGLVFSVISGATPNKATVETVEIDGKGHQHPHDVHHNHKAHEAKHDATHEAKHDDATHEAKHDATQLHEVHHQSHKAKHDATHHDHKKAKHHESKHTSAEHAHEEKPSLARKEQPAHASMAQQNVFSDEEEEDDAALDELEAMAIARTFQRKKTPPWGPPAAEPCTFQEWENEGSCGVTCGGRGKTDQKQSRGMNPAKHGGSPCSGKRSRQVECGLEECPTTTTTTEEEVTTTTGGALRMADLSNTVFLSSLMYALSLFV